MTGSEFHHTVEVGPDSKKRWITLSTPPPPSQLTWSEWDAQYPQPPSTSLPCTEMMPVSIVANFPGATQIFRMLGCASNTTAECLGNSTTVCEMTYDQV